METIFIKANPRDCQFLSELAFRSKSHWPYSNEYLAASPPLIAIHEQYLKTAEVQIGRANDEVFGFFGLCFEPDYVLLDHFWIEPKYMGLGLGRRMFHEVQKAVFQRSGNSRIRIYSDPPAEGFYLKMGATKIGEKPSRILGGPVFPVLEVKC